MKITRLLLLGLAILLVSGCPRTQQPDQPVAVKTVNDYFTIKVGARNVRMQLAVTEAEMEHGLMERRGLAPDEGMLFVYAQPQPQTFWMHDTPTPLDIGFFTRDGVLREIYQMQPFDESTTASRSKELQFALEMNQGWFHDNGVEPGAQLDLAALAAALKARGFEPAGFGLEGPIKSQ
jgi:uncharacterized protein